MRTKKVTNRVISLVMSVICIVSMFSMDNLFNYEAYADEINLSKEFEIKPDTAAKSISLDNDLSEIFKDKRIFDENERNNILNGTKATVSLTASGSTVKSLNDKEKESVNAIINAYNKDVRYVYYDIKLAKKVGNGSLTQINETEKKMSVSVALTDAIVNFDDAKVRNYGVIRVHKGEVSEINSDFNYSNNTITFNSDKFSTFILFYYDELAGFPVREGGFAAIKLAKNQFVYTGSEIRPNIKVWYSYQPNDVSGKRLGLKKTIALKENVDYVLSYENNVNAGTGKVIITGIGDYSLSETKEFQIIKKNAKSLKIKKMPTLSANGTDYKNTISENVIVMDGKNVVKPSEYSLKFDGSTVNAGKVTVSLVVNPEGNYWGEAKKAKATVNIISNAKLDVTKATVSMSAIKGNVYKGKEIKPKVKVTLDGVKVPAKYYTVVYENNINAGEAKVYVVGKGKGAGISEKVSFNIAPCDISKVKVKKYSKTYWRKSLDDIRPIIKSGKIFLTKDVDYKMEVSDIGSKDFIKNFDTKKSIPVVITIKPCEGNPNFVDNSSDHSGYKTTINITKRDIKSTLTTKVIGSKVYKADGTVEPVLVVQYLDEALIKDQDYKVVSLKVSTSGKDKVIKAKAKITGIGLYKGSRTVSWTIGQDK